MCVLNNRIIVCYGVLTFLKSQTQFLIRFSRMYFPEVILFRTRF